MIRKLNSSKSGFTLVEIMIVVAIIALLATIAVPSFLRARKRSQATKVVNDARIYEAAVDQWAIETNQKNTATYKFSQVSDYIKASSYLVSTSGQDVIGGTYKTGAVSTGIKVDSATYGDLSDVTTREFWGSYYP